MDTDSKSIRRVKAWFKEGLQRTQAKAYSGILSFEASTARLAESIRLDKPFCVGRLGSNEARVCARYLRGGGYTKDELYRITEHAGVFPKEAGAVDSFARIYTEAFTELDMLGVWYPRGEGYMIRNHGSLQLELAPLQCLEPYYDKEAPWSSALEGRRVLVLHPFRDSILSQYSKRKLLFETNVLPEFASLEVVQAIQSIAGENSGLPDWSAALEQMQQAMDAIDYEVCIVGAGAYGLPLAAHAKRRGKVAIHLGGATQLLFGIRGKRWEKHETISQLFNEHWVRPQESETPKRKEVVEGGSYW